MKNKIDWGSVWIISAGVISLSLIGLCVLLSISMNKEVSRLEESGYKCESFREKHGMPHTKKGYFICKKDGKSVRVG